MVSLYQRSSESHKATLRHFMTRGSSKNHQHLFIFAALWCRAKIPFLLPLCTSSSSCLVDIVWTWFYESIFLTHQHVRQGSTLIHQKVAAPTEGEESPVLSFIALEQFNAICLVQVCQRTIRSAINNDYIVKNWTFVIWLNRIGHAACIINELRYITC